ncbi:uncharacterized protein Z519_06419 [Cladophialophora bantiana CBS 173.52]|uniref:NmrA-like domain-containing protein n=1 Tax=Cladophialophora bantiana (strain ATCC 10958 / CBS 173.52 / CDC B-1940 / NIH 8579) TaxID=1442370 RepID=A0A0D2G1H5_CLAB1|nr:uncharacterized protein Z519_06419 [Cladophialophora bantiana CBS 173.52]KIW92572.1 hypothetical protein Z519_06419 [Cladophialophora bantiana CBS 173.52]
MASSSLKVIAVVGATGNQGSSRARTFRSLPGRHVRAVARYLSSQKAGELRVLGAELVRADLSDIASQVLAFGNSHAIFLNTDFWETYRSVGTGSGLTPLACSRAAYEKEVFYGKNAAIAAACVLSLERLVYSSLASIKAASNGKHSRSYHPESMAAIVSYIEAEEPALAKKMSIVIPAGYSTNPMFRPTLDPKSGQYIVVTALDRGCKMPILDPSEAMRPFVRALIEDEEPGTKLLAYNEDSFLSFEEIVQAWTDMTGKKVQIVRMNPKDLHEQLNLPWELLDAINFVNEHGYDYVLAREGIIQPRQLSNPPKTKSYKVWWKRKPMEALLG